MFSRLGAFFLDILQVIVFAVAIFLFVYLLVLQPHKIKGHSMDPNFEDGEFILTDKISYRLGDPEHGDVVVFKAPPDFQEEFIKRIIGVPGDKIKVQDNHVFVNGKQIDETEYLDPSVPTSSGTFTAEGTEITVTPGNYLVMGDNRPNSFDGRYFGLIPRERITGKAWLSYWPPKRAGTIKHYVFTTRG